MSISADQQDRGDPMTNGLYRVMLMALVCWMLGACAQSVEWTEEVQVTSGNQIRVEREQDWVRTSSIGESERFGERHARLKILGADAGDLPTWSGSYERPIVLGYDTEYFLLTAVETCGLWKKLGSPKPPYVEYRVRAARWTRLQLRQEHIGLAANLFVSPSRLHQPKSVSVDEKRRANAASTESVPGWYLRIQQDAQIFGCR
jgi:hypothetical protein